MRVKVVSDYGAEKEVELAGAGVIVWPGAGGEYTVNMSGRVQAHICALHGTFRIDLSDGRVEATKWCVPPEMIEQLGREIGINDEFEIVHEIVGRSQTVTLVDVEASVGRATMLATAKTGTVLHTLDTVWRVCDEDWKKFKRRASSWLQPAA